eukprot:4919753-Pleurochrysis_carterae.AAC.1
MTRIGGAVDGGGATVGAAVGGRKGVRPERVRVGRRRWRVEGRRERRCGVQVQVQGSERCSRG